jgi:perosamine synthetase
VVRSLSPTAASTTSRTGLYRLVGGSCRPVVRVLFRPRARGLENLPDGGFVLAANQLSNLDGFALAYALYPRQLRWMGKAELFNPVTAPALERLWIFPVRRGEGDLGAIATAAELARAGEIVVVFPEGTRRRKGLRKTHAARPHNGAARVAGAAGVPLVPAGIAGTERLTRLRRWRLAFGEPITPQFQARATTRELWDAITGLEGALERESERTPRRLWPRHRLDLRASDLLFALGACITARGEREERVLQAWSGGGEGLACLSVRSAFDLLLTALDLRAEDEIIVSAVTHPDMARLIEVHGLRAVPVDLDLETLAPRLDLLERAITPRSRAIVVAHLFGGRVDLTPVARVARAHDLLLVEDCAQSYRGPDHAGDPLADVSLFSFGAIKTATALGGAVVRVRDAELRNRMHLLQQAWPAQPRREYARRVGKFVPLHLLGRPRAYALFARTLERLGRDLDAVVNGAVRGFPGPDLLTRVRRRPSAPLLALVERRLRGFDRARLDARTRLGERVAAELSPRWLLPGGAALHRSHWVLPLLAKDRQALVAALRRRGFDAATATSGIGVVASERPDLPVSEAERMLSEIVFLPAYPELGEDELARLLAAVEAGVAD